MDLEGRIKISELQSHSKNTYYFDNIQGATWDALLESIKLSGVTNAVTITQNKTLISGHQRIRACKSLGIEEVSYKMVFYEDEKSEIKDMIESNLRQRVIGNENPIKLGRCFEFLNDYYNFKQGGDRKSKERLLDFNCNKNPNTQHELANSFGITQQTMSNYMKMAHMIPELEDLVLTGIVTKHTALAIIQHLSEKEQRELISSLDLTKKLTRGEIKQYIDKLQSAKKENKKLKEEKEQELESLRSENQSLKAAKENSDKMTAYYETQLQEYMDIKEKIARIALEPNDDFNIFNAAIEITKLDSELNELLQEKLAPIKYRSYLETVKQNPLVKKQLIHTLYQIRDWYTTILSYIGEEESNDIIDGGSYNE